MEFTEARHACVAPCLPMPRENVQASIERLPVHDRAGLPVADLAGAVRALEHGCTGG